jgi:hypothetical protein
MDYPVKSEGKGKRTIQHPVMSAKAKVLETTLRVDLVIYCMHQGCGHKSLMDLTHDQYVEYHEYRIWENIC